MQAFIGTVIILLGIVNVLRLGLLFVLGDLYDLFKHRRLNAESNKQKQRLHPLVTILIAAHNEALVIERTLTSVYKNTYSNFQVVVIDDGSTDETAQLVKKFKKTHATKQLTLIRQVNQGKAHALNHGLEKKARGSLVMTLDADSILAPDALERALRYFQNPHIKAVAANVRILPRATLLGAIQYVEYLMGYRLKKAYSIINNEYIIGGIGAMFRRNTMKKVGYYDTNTITEDIDLTLKIIATGNKTNQVIYAPDVICFTESVLTLSALFRQRLRWKYGRFQTLYKHAALIFSTDPAHTKLLTWLQLPFVIYSEFTFLLDPLLIGYIAYLSWMYRDTGSFSGMIIFIGFFVLVTVATDEHTTWKEKLRLAMYAPLAYFFFFVISVVEYLALIKCIADYRGIIHAQEFNSCSWQHVERAG